MFQKFFLILTVHAVGPPAARRIENLYFTSCDPVNQIYHKLRESSHLFRLADRLSIDKINQDIVTLLKDAKDTARTEGTSFPHIHYINSPYIDFVRWTEEEKDFALNVINSLHGAFLSHFISIEDPYVRARIVSKTEHFTIDLPSNPEIRDIMAHPNPTILDFLCDTELDSTNCTKLERIRLKLYSPAQTEQVLPQMFQVTTAKWIEVQTSNWNNIARSEIGTLVERISRPHHAWTVINHGTSVIFRSRQV
jgi:hypothetical protein